MMETIKYGLTRAGEHCTEKTIHWLNSCVNYLEVGRWMRAQGFALGKRFQLRDQLFEAISIEIGRRPVLYLEFGVFKGDSIRRWASLLSHPASHLEGFDSFEGLPEDWGWSTDRGAFSMNGAVPQIDDARIRFHKGWFTDTVAAFKPPPHEVFVANFDADLYSSSRFVLNQIKSLIVPGCYLYFDEFSGRH